MIVELSPAVKDEYPRVPNQIWSCRSLSMSWAERRVFQGCSKTGLAVLFLVSIA